MSSQTETVEFVPLNGFVDDYEILNQYPFTIRKKSNHYIPTTMIDKKDGYEQVCLNCKYIRKHRLIALQFIPNDDPINKEFVDHINHNRTDNHLSNLRWVSHSENMFNKSSQMGVQYEFVDDIPNDAMVVDFYDTRTEHYEFENEKYYYYFNEETNDDVFYGKIDDNTYRVLNIITNKTGCSFVSMKATNNKRVSVVVNKFKYQHGLI